ncbi:MAG: hypothetical protein LBG96_16635 [Tannerella sp.]|jgi:hypothetical protein|nr:hypothetical protein [Tannerella sp.]
MKKCFLIAQFVCACIIFLCFGTGFVLNVKNIAGTPDGVVILFVGLFIIYMCYLLIREAYKELKE